MQELIKEFMAQKRFAVVGATDNPQKYGNQVVKNLQKRGYEVYPVNPKLTELEGLKCYASLAGIPVKVDVVDFVVPPGVTEETLKQCKRTGIRPYLASARFRKRDRYRILPGEPHKGSP